jgi:hypothetical protein
MTTTKTIKTYELANGTKVWADTSRKGPQVPYTFDLKPVAFMYRDLIIADGFKAEVIGKPRQYMIKIND